MGDSGAPSADGPREEAVRMEEVEGNSFANWVNTDDEGKASATILRLEDVENDSFARWVNTDNEVEREVQKDVDSGEGHSESSKMQVEIQEAVWSTVFVDEGASASKSSLGSTGQPNTNVPDNRSAFSNITASDTTSKIEKREFLRRNKGELSDEGSPGGVNNEDLSLLVQGQVHSSRTPLRASERRRARRKHRQVSKPQSSSPGSGGEMRPESGDNSMQGSRNNSPGQNDENDQRNQNPSVSLGVGEGSCTEREELEQTKKDLLATLVGAGTSNQDGELDEQSVASNSSMANSVREVIA